MKILLIATFCSVTLILSSFGQTPPPPAGASPANLAGTPPAAAVTPTLPGLTPAPGMTPSTAAMPPAATSASGSPTVAASPAVPESAFDKNFFVDNFRKGGPI